MSTPLAHQQALEKVQQQQQDAATKLARILDREAEAIKKRDADALTALAPEKIDGLKRLEALEQSRLELTAVTGAAPSSSTKKQRERVLTIIRVCERKNQLNGVMLSMRQEHIQRAMDLIADRDRAAITYAPDGSTQITAGKFSTSVSA